MLFYKVAIIAYIRHKGKDRMIQEFQDWGFIGKNFSDGGTKDIFGGGHRYLGLNC